MSPDSRHVSERATGYRNDRRRRLVVLTPYAVLPPRHGPQVRVAGILGNLGDGWEVVHFCQSIQRRDLPFPPKARRGGPHWVEYRLRDPVSAAWLIGLSKLGGFGAAYADRLLGLAPRMAIRRALASADLVMVSPHYQYPWVRRHVYRRTPIVVDCHMIEHQVWHAREARWTKIVAAEIERGERFAFTNADTVFATSAEDAAIVRDLGGRQVVVVPNGVDTDRFRPATPAERAELRRRLGLPGNGVIAVFVGAGGYDNRDALALLERQRNAYAAAGVRIVVVGRVGLVREHVPGILYAGEVEDVAEWVRAADIGLCALLGGSGTSLKTVEYLAAGIAVAGSEAGVRGLNVVDGIHAAVAGPDQVPTVVAELAADPARRAALGAAGRRLAEESFSWRSVGAIAEAEMERLVTSR